MSKTVAQRYVPPVMCKELADQWAASGFIIPPSWPFPARPVVEFGTRYGWTLRQPGGFKVEGKAEYQAPDGVVYVKASKRQTPRLIVLGTHKSPAPFRLVPKAGQKVRRWPDEPAPVKGEAPAHLRAFLFKKKGAVELPRDAKGRVSAVAVLGPRPAATDRNARREWNRQYRALRAEHFAAYRASRSKGGRQAVSH